MNNARATEPSKLWNADFVLLSVSALLFYLSFYLLLSVLPGYVKEIGGGAQSVGFVMGAFALSSLACRPIIGHLVDRTSKRRLVILGTIIFTGAPLLYWYAHSMPALIAVRILHGAGIALFTTASTTMVADLTPSAQRGEAMGIFGTTANIALGVGPWLGTALVSGSGFFGLFIAAAIIAAGSVVTATPVRDTARLLHAPQPIRGLSSLFSTEVLVPSIGILAVMLTYAPLITFLPLYAGYKTASLFFLIYAITVTLARSIAGRLSDTHGRRAVILPGIIIMAGSMAIIALVHGTVGVIICAITYALGMALAQPALYAMAVDLVTHSRRGVAMGTFTAGFELGIGAGAIAGGGLVTSVGYAPMFLIAGGICAASAILFVKRQPAG